MTYPFRPLSQSSSSRLARGEGEVAGQRKVEEGAGNGQSPDRSDRNGSLNKGRDKDNRSPIGYCPELLSSHPHPARDHFAGGSVANAVTSENQSPSAQAVNPQTQAQPQSLAQTQPQTLDQTQTNSQVHTLVQTLANTLASKQNHFKPQAPVQASVRDPVQASVQAPAQAPVQASVQAPPQLDPTNFDPPQMNPIHQDSTQNPSLGHTVDTPDSKERNRRLQQRLSQRGGKGNFGENFQTWIHSLIFTRKAHQQSEEWGQSENLPRSRGRRLLLLIAAIAVPAFAAPNVWQPFDEDTAEEAAHTPSVLAKPLPFELAEQNFPGSAFYYLQDAPRAEFDLGDRELALFDISGTGDADQAALASIHDAGPAANAFAASGSGLSRGRALECLTKAVYYEAASEATAGQRAVAQVVLNRVAHPSYPSSVCGVVFQGSERKTGCQFSFTCDGSLNRQPGAKAWARARIVARDALSGHVYKAVGLATHYHTIWIYPYWAPSLRHIGTIGAHRFYRWKGSAGKPNAFRSSYSGTEPAAVPHRKQESAASTAGAAADPLALEKAFEEARKKAVEAAEALQGPNALSSLANNPLANTPSNAPSNASLTNSGAASANSAAGATFGNRPSANASPTIGTGAAPDFSASRPTRAGSDTGFNAASNPQSNTANPYAPPQSGDVKKEFNGSGQWIGRP